MAKLLHSITTCIGLAAIFSVCAYAQFNGNIQGIVSDSSGAVVANASVLLRNVDTGVEAQTTTSASGNYRFSSLEPGHYLVITRASGFRETQVDVTLGTSETQGINVTLQLASSTQSVNVVEQAPALDTDDSRLQATLSSNTVRDLPEINRNIYDVLAVAPGVVGTGTRGAGESPGGGNDNFGTQTPSISANGRSYTGNRVVVDGMDATSVVQNGNFIYGPNPDAIQEVSLQTNSWDAENNVGSSVLIQITTKSGTNQFHGTGSLLFTNQDLLARSVFTATSSYPPFSRKDLSAALGGPIIKNKTFFFADVESLWSTSSTANSVQTYESPQFVTWAQQNFPNTLGTKILTGNPVTSVATTGVSETAQKYFGSSCGTAATAYIPCSMPVLDQGNEVLSPFYNGLQYNFRGDQYIGLKDRVYGSYANDTFTLQHPNVRTNFTNEDFQNNWYAQTDWTHTFSPNVLFEFGFGANAVGGENGQNGNNSIPQINVTGQSIGFTNSWGPGEYRSHNYNWRDVLNIVHGAHTLKFGSNGAHADEEGDFTPVNVRPTFTFNNLLDLVEDSPYQETVGAYNLLTGGPGNVGFGGQLTAWGFFVQDDWKAKSNLSFTFSLRWDDFGNHYPWGNNFQFYNLILGSGSTFNEQIANASVKQVNDVFAKPLDNLWSPRIGFAWDPSHHGAWSIRGGVGVFHDWVTLGQSVDEMRNNAPTANSETFTAGGTGVQPLFALAPSSTYPFNYPLPTIPAGQLNAQGGLAGAPGAITALNRNMEAPYAVNYVIGVEHQFPWKLVAGANYSGSRGYDALTGTDVNRYAGAVIPTNGQGNPPRLNSSFSSIDYVTNWNRSTYNAAIFSLRRTFASRSTFQASYTRSHAMDFPEAGTRFDQDTGLGIPDQNQYFSYWGDSNWDVRNRFSFSGTYTVPGLHTGWGRVLTSGWEVSTIAAIQSGTPFWVYTTAPYGAGGDYNADGYNWDVPNAPSVNYTGSHSEQAYINGLFTAADFPVPAVGTEGNLKRNIYQNPGMISVDASVLKNTRVPFIGEQGNLQLRFDFINVLNHVNLGPVDANMADATFGQATTTLNPRSIQLGARISF